MKRQLSDSEQDRVITNTIELTLDNFSLAWHVADLLIEYAATSLPWPQATVFLSGLGRSVQIPGRNCGFFTTPVIHTAILDCRRSLEFFGLAFDSQKRSFEPIKKKRRKDDLGIEHFGLQRATINDLVGASSIASCVPLEHVLAEIHHWSNKRLAHFTLLEPDIDRVAIRDMCKAMIDAYLRLLFDALGRPRPRIQPANSQIP